MKNRTYRLWIKFGQLFKKKKFSHIDNLPAIMNLLKTGDYKNLEIWQTLNLFESVREELIKDMQKEKEDKLYDLAKIEIFFNKEGIE